MFLGIEISFIDNDIYLRRNYAKDMYFLGCFISNNGPAYYCKKSDPVNLHYQWKSSKSPKYTIYILTTYLVEYEKEFRFFFNNKWDFKQKFKQQLLFKWQLSLETKVQNNVF